MSRPSMTARLAEPLAPVSAMAVPDVEYIVPHYGLQGGLGASPATPRIFKSRKSLPRPRNPSLNGSLFDTPESRRSSSGSQRYAHMSHYVCSCPRTGPGSHVASIHTLRHQRRSISGGELPPTPPAHSRTSSSSHSINISTLSPLQTPAQSSEDVLSKKSPTTPPNQRSPPTPEVTPPRPEARATASPLRPTLYNRIPSKCTTDSRTESFKTALESPEPSDEEDSTSTQRPVAPSAKASQITVRRIDSGDSNLQTGVGLGLDAGPDPLGELDDLTPTPKGEFISFDGEWESSREVEQEWDDNLARNVTVKKRRPSSQVSGEKHEVVGAPPVVPTNATKAARAFPLRGRVLTYDSREPARSFTAPETATIEPSTLVDARRMSGMSSKSAASTVVEAILVETATPRRRKTLRHVKRVDALRDSVWQPSPVRTVASPRANVHQRRPTNQAMEAPRESFASTATVNSISSRKARREVWKNGGIPVVVVPDRLSSNRSSSQDRSLRSTSSHRSRRSQSIGSVPPQVSNEQDLTYFDRPSRRFRRSSESDGSAPGDQRTMDYPPVDPRRTSSLSAPTSRNGSREASRNGSRAGSLTAESLKAHDNLVLANEVANTSSRGTVDSPSSRTETSVPLLAVQSVASEAASTPSYNQFKIDSSQGEADEHRRRTVDTLFGSPLLSTHATPFSQASEETAGTAAEIAQAKAVSIMPHKNRSVLVVHHRPSESSDGDRGSQGAERQQRPMITTEVGGNTEEQPVTPSQTQPPLSLDGIDSPLRNPRAPPEPPILRFIPATPSGLTPAEERPRLLGNLYDEDEDAEEKPARGLQLVRRALGKRRHSSHGPSPSREARPGFLARTLSLSKTIRKETAEQPELDQDDEVMLDVHPRDESRLHPDWRPSYYPGFDESDGYGSYDVDDDQGEEAMRYPVIDNRPRPPKRSLSQCMKRTFAIMPIQDDYDVYDQDGTPERRTIKRSPSGSLRVVKHRGSMETLRGVKRRADTAPVTRRGPVFPRSYSLTRMLRRDSDSESEIRRHGLKRMWSLTESVQGIPRRLSEKRRQKRSNELRQKISGPRDVRDGVDDVIRRDGLRGAYERPRKAEVIAWRDF